VAWLLGIHDPSNRVAFRATRLASYLLAVVVAEQLAETARDYLHDTFRSTPPSWLSSFLTVYVVVVGLLVLAHFVFYKRLVALAEPMAEVAAYGTIAYAVLTLGLFSWFSGLDRPFWAHGTPLAAANVVVLSALLLPALALVLQLLALPGPKDRPAANSTDDAATADPPSDDDARVAVGGPLDLP
jgi:hypothetical protein